MSAPQSSSPAAQAQAAALADAIQQLFGTALIGFSVSTTLYGITVLQTYLYFRTYTKDSWFLKLTVGLLWVLDTLTTIFVAHSLYTYYVLNFGKSLTLDLVIPWSFTSEKLLVTIITFIAQIFYARTIWRVSENIIASSIILLFAVVAFALGLVTSVHLFQEPLVTSISKRSFTIISGLVQGFASLDDVLITIAMCYFLQARKTGFKTTTEKVVDTLMLFAVSRGILTAVTQILFLALNVGLPHDTFWQPFHQAVGKLYLNSVLATLNVRQTLRDRRGSMINIGGKHSDNTDETTRNEERVSKLQFADQSETRATEATDVESGFELRSSAKKEA